MLVVGDTGSRAICPGPGTGTFCSNRETNCGGGVMAINIYNKYVNLNPVIAAIAEHRGFVAIGRYDEVSDAIIHSSRWVAVARDQATLDALLRRAGWKRLAPERDLVWTDDKSGLFELLNIHPGFIK